MKTIQVKNDKIEDIKTTIPAAIKHLNEALILVSKCKGVTKQPTIEELSSLKYSSDYIQSVYKSMLRSELTEYGMDHDVVFNPINKPNSNQSLQFVLRIIDGKTQTLWKAKNCLTYVDLDVLPYIEITPEGAKPIDNLNERLLNDFSVTCQNRSQEQALKELQQIREFLKRHNLSPHDIPKLINVGMIGNLDYIIMGDMFLHTFK